jgi:phosphatidylglycerol lysyltransferase
VQIGFGLAQISLMTTILYLFMPPELNLTWPAFVAIYCLAFVAGQLSNVPAGLGVLEAALLLLLPQIPPGKLVGAVLAYRAVYELIPLLCALVLLLIYETTNPAGIVRRKKKDLRI